MDKCHTDSTQMNLIFFGLSVAAMIYSKSTVIEYLADIWCCLFFLEEELLLVEGCLMTCATPTLSVWLDGSVTWPANKAGCCMMGL